VDKRKGTSNLTTTKEYVFVVLLNFIQSVGRFLFAIMGLNGGIDQFLDVPVSTTTALILHVMFFILGITGFIAAIGLWRKMRWGVRAVISVSTITIIFDMWGFTIQKTAALGFIVPVISLVYLMSRRSRVITA
jgi:hypothetical protein